MLPTHARPRLIEPITRGQASSTKISVRELQGSIRFTLPVMLLGSCVATVAQTGVAAQPVTPPTAFEAAAVLPNDAAASTAGSPSYL